MRDLIIENPEEKKATLLTAAGPLPAGTELRFRLDYLNPALDNNPTKLNKSTLLSDTTQVEVLKMPPDSDGYTGTVDDAWKAVRSLIWYAQPSTFQRIMTGRFI